MKKRLGLLALVSAALIPAAAHAQDGIRFFDPSGQFGINVDSGHGLPVNCVLGCSGSGGGGGSAPSATVGQASPTLRSPLSYKDFGTGNEDPAIGDGTGLYAKIVNASLAVTQSGAWTVGISGTVAVSGAVSVSNFPATQAVSGSVTANQGGAPWSTTITGTLPAFAATPTVNCGSGCFQATQPVSGTVATITPSGLAMAAIPTPASPTNGAALTAGPSGTELDLFTSAQSVTFTVEPAATCGVTAPATGAGGALTGPAFLKMTLTAGQVVCVFAVAGGANSRGF